MIKLKYLLTENLDTEIEMLKKYMKAGGERTTKIDSTIKSLYSKKSKYSKELNPISGEVYRGTAISKKDLKKLDKLQALKILQAIQKLKTKNTTSTTLAILLHCLSVK